MTREAFHHRVDELIAKGKFRDEAISQAAWEEDHGRIPIDVPVVVDEVAA